MFVIGLITLSSGALAADETDRDQGWDRDFGLVVELNNVFSTLPVLRGYQGYGAAVFVPFTERVALRAGVDFDRFADPVFETTTVVRTGEGEPVETVTVGNRFGGPTSLVNIAIGGDVLVRASERVVAPYFGGGLFVVSDSSRRRFTDEVSEDDTVTSVDDRSSQVSVGVRGILGADWRVHKHFSLFAEYGLGVTLANSTRTRTSTVTEVDIGDEVVTTEITTDGSQTAVFDTATALVQGAALGVIMHF